jgi:hypothetical protein
MNFTLPGRLALLAVVRYAHQLAAADFDRHTAEALAVANTTDLDTCQRIMEASE